MSNEVEDSHDQFQQAVRELGYHVSGPLLTASSTLRYRVTITVKSPPYQFALSQYVAATSIEVIPLKRLLKAITDRSDAALDHRLGLAALHDTSMTEPTV